MITFREFLNLCEDYNPNAEFVIYNKKTKLRSGVESVPCSFKTNTKPLSLFT